MLRQDGEWEGDKGVCTEHLSDIRKDVARMGVAARSFYKFSPPRVETNCCRGVGGLSRSLEKCGTAEISNFGAAARSPGRMRWCLASRHRCELAPKTELEVLSSSVWSRRAVGLLGGWEGAGREKGVVWSWREQSPHKPTNVLRLPAPLPSHGSWLECSALTKKQHQSQALSF